MPAIIVLALSAAVKLYPALLLAAFLNRGDRIKGTITFSAAIVLLYLPFLGAGGKISGFLPVYLKNPAPPAADNVSRVLNPQIVPYY